MILPVVDKIAIGYRVAIGDGMMANVSFQVVLHLPSDHCGVWDGVWNSAVVEIVKFRFHLHIASAQVFSLLPFSLSVCVYCHGSLLSWVTLCVWDSLVCVSWPRSVQVCMSVVFY